MVVAHRGAARDEPENTIPAFEAALDRQQCTALEIDLCLTRDGEVVVWHDWDPANVVSLGRQSALEEEVLYRPVAPNLGSKWRRPVCELTLAELREHYGYGRKSVGSNRIEASIPTFAEFLEWATTRNTLKHLHLDIKIPKSEPHHVDPMLDRIDALLTEHTPTFDVIYSTPCMPVLEAMERRSFHPDYAFDVEPPFGFVFRPRRFSSAKVAVRFKNAFATSVHPKVTTIAPWTTYRRVVREDIRIRERHNRTNPEVPIKRVFAATINERDLIRCLLAIGVDGLITDCPDVVREEAMRAGRKAC
jgi:glycerophosphoryl diester phosphodiesterase